MEIKKIALYKYEIAHNNKIAKVEFYRNARYDSFDGKYHPAWVVVFNGVSYVRLSKEAALTTAKKMLTGEFFEMLSMNNKSH